MPAPRLGNQWPTAGERSSHCVWQRATFADDTIGGTDDATWTAFATWWAKALTVPSVQGEMQAAILYQVEGPYRSDVWTYFLEGKGLRLVVNGLTLKVFELENTRLINRTLVAHCASVTA